LNAARAAIQEGIVPGGGVTLYRISVKLNPEASIGNKILRKALKAPLNQILENIGLTLTEEIETAILSDTETTYDARNKIIVNAFQAGIVDPVKVTRTALENAISISSLLSTAGGCIVYVKE
jgi:chaperonin GroEL